MTLLGGGVQHIQIATKLPMSKLIVAPCEFALSIKKVRLLLLNTHVVVQDSVAKKVDPTIVTMKTQIQALIMVLHLET